MQVSKHHRYVHSCIGMVNSAVLMLWDVKYRHQKNNKTMEAIMNDILDRNAKAMQLFPGWQQYLCNGKKTREAGKIRNTLEKFKYEYFYKEGKHFPALFYASFLIGVMSDCRTEVAEVASRKKDPQKKEKAEAIDSVLTGVKSLLRYFDGRTFDEEVHAEAANGIQKWAEFWGIA